MENEYSYYGLGYFSSEPDKLADWKKFLPPIIRSGLPYRQADEAKLKAEGYTIDTSYEDPPFEAEALRALAENGGNGKH